MAAQTVTILRPHEAVHTGLLSFAASEIQVNTCVLSSFSGLFSIAISVQKPPETGVANLRPVGLASALRALSLGYAKRESEALQHFAHALWRRLTRDAAGNVGQRAETCKASTCMPVGDAISEL